MDELNPIIVTQDKPLIMIHEFAKVDVDYNHLMRAATNRTDGLLVMTGWWPQMKRFNKPLYIKLVDVEEYMIHGNGD